MGRSGGLRPFQLFSGVTDSPTFDPIHDLDLLNDKGHLEVAALRLADFRKQHPDSSFVLVGKDCDLFDPTTSYEDLAEAIGWMQGHWDLRFLVATKYPELITHRLTRIMENPLTDGFHQDKKQFWHSLRNIGFGVIVEDNNDLFNVRNLQGVGTFRFVLLRPKKPLYMDGSGSVVPSDEPVPNTKAWRDHSDRFSMFPTRQIFQLHRLVDWIVVDGSYWPMHPDWVRPFLQTVPMSRPKVYFRSWGSWRPARWSDGANAFLLEGGPTYKSPAMVPAIPIPEFQPEVDPILHLWKYHRKSWARVIDVSIRTGRLKVADTFDGKTYHSVPTWGVLHGHAERVLEATVAMSGGRRGRSGPGPGPRPEIGLVGPIIAPVPVLYLDLDESLFGTLREWETYVFNPGRLNHVHIVPELVMRYRMAGWRVVGMVTSPGVGSGRVPLEAVYMAVMHLQGHMGMSMDFVSLCMHSPKAKLLEQQVCWCRRPKPGLIIQSAERLEHMHIGEMYPPHLSLVVGKSKARAVSAKTSSVEFQHFDDWINGEHVTRHERLQAS